VSDVPPRDLAWSDIVIADQDGDVVQTIPAPAPVDPAAVRPSVDDVAALEATRTIDEGGAETGTFSNSTRPTAADVERLIDQAVSDVLAQLPPNIDRVWDSAIGRAIALRVAWMVEASYYREAAVSGVGPASEYQGRFVADLQALQGLIPKATYIA
jgi:hypothetical protein